jgi:hypothetical protein
MSLTPEPGGPILTSALERAYNLHRTFCLQRGMSVPTFEGWIKLKHDQGSIHLAEWNEPAPPLDSPKPERKIRTA